ncbi:Hsp20/alpha crystallin family protein [Leptospira langatensis]|uniref:Hsp20/alpha crystallin family protein n=1 Tax=Leptospira langatensis TaxID=2484983 RepID=A0A5F1ZZD3_9LEPT|nr:Hsp20/alpha crystallin family protein [Leptospira langatensis]TGJ98452.1 Hsp20/alpha crystallin family protein [Leptospira langatensis]TGL43367.1 Hsp20/alpha crystallin family protein [Leptospira langatensis]
MNSLSKLSDNSSGLSSLDHFFQTWNEFLHKDNFRHVPAVNVIKTKEGFEMDFAVPGLDKKDIDVDIEGDLLTISAHKKSETSEKDKDYSKREYNYSSFSRSFTLPDSVQKDKISASYENGVLKLSLPKTETEQKKSPIKIGVK